MSSRHNKRLGPAGWVGRFGKAGADKNGLRAELHHERGIRRSSDTAGGEIRHRKLAVLLEMTYQINRRAKVFGFCHELLIVKRGDPPNGIVNSAHVTDSLDNIARAGFALGADHGCPLADPAERLAQVTAAADKRDLEFPFIDM